MKLKDLQKIDQDIIKALADHKGIERAINGKTLAVALGIELRTLQSRAVNGYTLANIDWLDELIKE